VVEILGSPGGEDIGGFLGCDTVDLLLDIRISEKHSVSTLKMEAIYISETLVPTYKLTWHHNPEDYRQHQKTVFILRVSVCCLQFGVCDSRISSEP
jgi:hypothetical protein